jgi:hypothetical protein
MSDPRSGRLRVAFAFGAVSLFVGLAAWPGLRGDWVGDDFHMVNSPLYGDWSEVFRVFSRHAGHYLEESPDPGMAAPYRPVAMFTLLFAHALVPEPWLHHLVSWLMHIATGGLLLVALLRQTPAERHPSARSVSVVLVSLFLLHPATVEAYVFINGRSDLVAGLCLAALAVVLLRGSLTRTVQWLVIPLIGFLGAASKLTFVPAALALWLGLSLRSDPRRDALRSGPPLVVALLALLGLRVANAPVVGRLGATDDVARNFSAFADVPQLLAKGAAAIVSFRSEAMQSLAWELFLPFSLAEWVGAFVLLATVAALALRRDVGGVVLIAGFAATLAPSVMVSRAFWLGFDRYLYMPLILVVLAISPHVVAAVEAVPRRRRLWVGVAGALVLLAALATRTSSLAYVNQTTFEAAITDDHPEDPTMVYYMASVATKSGSIEAGRRWLSRIPDPPWPVAIVEGTVELATELDDPRVRDMAAEYLATIEADDTSRP